MVFQECILFLLSKPYFPKLVQQDSGEKTIHQHTQVPLSPPGKTFQSLFYGSLGSFPTLVSPPNAQALAEQAATGRSRRARSHSTQTPLPQSNSRAGGCKAAPDPGAAGRNLHDVCVRDRERPFSQRTPGPSA